MAALSMSALEGKADILNPFSNVPIDPKEPSLSTDRSINRYGDGSVGAAPLLYGVCFNIMISSMVQSDLERGRFVD